MVVSRLLLSVGACLSVCAVSAAPTGECIFFDGRTY
jgi:hypothetical protein